MNRADPQIWVDFYDFLAGQIQLEYAPIGISDDEAAQALVNKHGRYFGGRQLPNQVRELVAETLSLDAVALMPAANADYRFFVA